MLSKFTSKIIQITKLIPEGTVASYGQVALMAGVPRAARQVGWILHSYSDEYNLPWWRVINNAGRISTSCTDHTATTQKQMLISEGVVVKQHFTIDIERYRYRPDSKTIKSLELEPEYIYMLMEKYSL